MSRNRSGVPKEVPKGASRNYFWTFTEKQSLLSALEKYGFNNIPKLAEEVKTKSESEVKYFIHKGTIRAETLGEEEIQKIMHEVNSHTSANQESEGDEQATNFSNSNGCVSITTCAESGAGVQTVNSNKSNANDPEVRSQNSNAHADEITMTTATSCCNGPCNYSAVDDFLSELELIPEQQLMQWKKILMSLVTMPNRHADYSSIILDIFEKFAEEEPDYDDPNLPNLKAVYKYICDAMRGDLPAKLSPLDTAVMDLLLNDLTCFEKSFNLEVEKNFLKEFMTPVTFTQDVPVQEPVDTRQKKKKESVKRLKLESATTNNSNIIPVPQHVFEDYKRHQKVKDNINPLVVPQWLLQNEQEKISEFFKNISKT